MSAVTSIRSESHRPWQRRETEVLRVGSWHTGEFAAVAELEGARTVARVEDAHAQLAEADAAPGIILIAQSLPGDVCQQDIDRLQRVAPLARIVIVAGSWCEGELRTGHPPTGALRLYWYELGPWWRAGQRRIAAGLAPAWSAPLDHPRAGRLRINRIASSSSPAVVAIHADDYSMYECFGDAEIRAVWTRGETVAAQAGIFDGGQLGDRELERLAGFCKQVAGPVVALLDFPRVEHISQAKAAGAAAVFAKPFVVEEVIAALVR